MTDLTPREAVKDAQRRYDASAKAVSDAIDASRRSMVRLQRATLAEASHDLQSRGIIPGMTVLCTEFSEDGLNEPNLWKFVGLAQDVLSVKAKIKSQNHNSLPFLVNPNTLIKG